MPIQQTIEFIKQLGQIDLKPNVLVTDAGSTKTEIIQAGDYLSEKKLTLSGSHPMAGSHKSGAEAGDIFYLKMHITL